MSSTYNDPVARPTGILETATVNEARHTNRRVSWGAIFGGMVVMLATQVLLSMLGAGVGFSTVDVVAGQTPTASSLGIGAAVWWIASTLIALAFGGFVAAWLAGIGTRGDGMLHGLIAWGLASFLTLYLLTSAIGGVLGTSFSALGSVVSAAGSAVKDAAKPVAEATGITPDMIQQQAQAYLQPVNPDPATMTDEQAQKAVAQNLVTFAKGGPDAAGAKDRIIAISAAKQNISREQATKQFEDAQAKLQQQKQEAIATAKKAADASAAAAAKTSFGGFVFLLIGAVSAALGGAFAVQRRTVVTNRIR